MHELATSRWIQVYAIEAISRMTKLPLHQCWRRCIWKRVWVFCHTSSTKLWFRYKNRLSIYGKHNFTVSNRTDCNCIIRTIHYRTNNRNHCLKSFSILTFLDIFIDSFSFRSGIWIVYCNQWLTSYEVWTDSSLCKKLKVNLHSIFKILLELKREFSFRCLVTHTRFEFANDNKFSEMHSLRAKASPSRHLFHKIKIWINLNVN